ncbi:hypothetical protein BY998_10461 [Methylobacterium sp. B4]|nr:hypothetical protein BY998_10461 [Methylobacterium sp. B4]
MQGYNVQEADRMSVAIHPSEARRGGSKASARPRMRTIAAIGGGGVAVLAFAAGAFSFFSDLADPRARPVRSAPVAPVASQWPDLKDGVPALATASAEPPPELRRASLPAAEPPPAAIAAPAPVQAASVQAAPASVPPGPAALPIEPVQTVPPAARTTASVSPAKVAVPLPPTRSETVRAKAEQPAKFVSLPATKPETARTEAAKPERGKAEASKPEAIKSEAIKAEAARKTVAPARARAPEAKPTQTASAQAPAASPPAAREASDEPELLGVKIPGGRQIREGWDAAVSGLLGDK